MDSQLILSQKLSHFECASKQHLVRGFHNPFLKVDRIFLNLCQKGKVAILTNFSSSLAYSTTPGGILKYVTHDFDPPGVVLYLKVGYQTFPCSPP